jgi:hypothetical protein
MPVGRRTTSYGQIAEFVYSADNIGEIVKKFLAYSHEFFRDSAKIPSNTGDKLRKLAAESPESV